MSQTDLNRVRDDLDTMKQAAGIGLPFGREDVRMGIWLAVCGILISAWALLGPWEYRQVVFIPLGLAILVAARTAAAARRQRGSEPARWREHRLSLVGLLVILPIVFGYMRWERQLGLPREVVGAAAVFFTGAGLLVFAVADPKRRYVAGAAIPLMVTGLAIPLCTPSQVLIGAGLCWTVAGLATAAIQHWQLRRYGRDHAAI